MSTRPIIATLMEVFLASAVFVTTSVFGAHAGHRTGGKTGWANRTINSEKNEEAKKRLLAVLSG